MQTQGKNIIKGADVTLTIVIRNTNGDPLDLTGATEITARFRKANKTALEKKLSEVSVSVASAINGRISIELTDQDTDALNPMPNAPIEVWIDFGTLRRIAQIRSGLNVIERLI